MLSIDLVEADGGGARVLPSTSVVLGFQFRGRVRAEEEYLALAGVTGIQATAKRYSYEPQTGSLLVRFTPEGAACLGVPIVELSGRSVALDDILPRARVAELRARVADALDDDARIAVVQDFLAGLPLVGDHVIARAIRLLEAAVERLARDLFAVADAHTACTLTPVGQANPILYMVSAFRFGFLGVADVFGRDGEAVTRRIVAAIDQREECGDFTRGKRGAFG